MSWKTTFTLPVVPTAQQRARHTRTGRAYKSAVQTANERTLEALLLPHIPKKPLGGALRLEIVASMPIPASTSKRRAEAMLAGKIGHTHKPDVDNLAKQLLDACTRLRFWEDDRQVVSLSIVKRYATAPCWIVSITPLYEDGEE